MNLIILNVYKLSQPENILMGANRQVGMQLHNFYGPAGKNQYLSYFEMSLEIKSQVFMSDISNAFCVSWI